MSHTPENLSPAARAIADRRGWTPERMADTLNARDLCDVLVEDRYRCGKPAGPDGVCESHEWLLGPSIVAPRRSHR